MINKNVTTDKVKIAAEKVLSSLGHKLKGMYWYDVHHGSKLYNPVPSQNDYSDAISIDCSECRCHFDMNMSSINGHYLLWLGCRGIAEFRILGLQQAIIQIDKKEVIPSTVCEKYRSMI